MTKIANHLCGGKILRTPDAMETFNEHLLGMEQLELIDFKHELSTFVSPPEIAGWDEHVVSKIRFQMEWELMHKLGNIKMHSELVNQNLFRAYLAHSIDDASV